MIKIAIVLLAVLAVVGCAVALPTATVTPIPVASGCACATPAPINPPGGLSRDSAIAAAIRLAPPAGNVPAVIWAETAGDPFASPGDSERGLVWEVRLQGSFAASPCPPGFLERPPSLADTSCLDGESGVVVVLDYFTGALIGWMH